MLNQMLNKLSHKLMSSTWIPWRWRHKGGPLNTVLHTKLRRYALGKAIRKAAKTQPDDITILLGTRDRDDFRLERALQSIRNQDYPQHLIKILVVDYGNTAEMAEWLGKLVSRYGGQVVHTKAAKDAWNRSHCLNVGIRAIDTKFLVSSDVDIIFAPNYMSTAVAILKEKPFQVILSMCMDLPAAASKMLKKVDQPLNYDALHTMSKGRQIDGYTYSEGISLSYTRYYQAVRGYDEFFERWGSEDNDMIRRLDWLGVSYISVADKTSYYHQWHPKHEGVKDDTIHAIIKRNGDYARQSHKIIANDENWGAPR